MNPVHDERRLANGREIREACLPVNFSQSRNAII